MNGVFHFFEQSALQGENITQPFIEIGRAYLKEIATIQSQLQAPQVKNEEIRSEAQEGTPKSKEIVVQVQEKDYLVQVPNGSFDKTESFTVQVKEGPSSKSQSYTVQVQDGSVKIKAQDSGKVEGVIENIADKRLDSFELDVNDIKIQGVDTRQNGGCCVVS